MDSSPSIKTFLPTIVILVFLGWGGLVILLNSTEPTLGPRWLFFFLVVVALTGTALPATIHLNHRFPSKPPANARVMVRQALWIGAYGATMVWLNYGQVISFNLALIFLVGFMAIEVFLRLWERSQWQRP